jgi:CheY-like chemotaxis protein
MRSMNTSAETPILIVVDDLVFATKISETARRLGIPVESASIDALRTRLDETRPKTVIIDLNHRSGRAVETVRALKADPAWQGIVCGFVSHVRSELIQAARQAGCDLVLARSAFSRDLPQLLAQFIAQAPPSSPQS